MQVGVIGGGMYGRGGKSVLLVLSMQELGQMVAQDRGASKRTLAEIIAIDECERFVTHPVEESPHPGERHREVVSRVNSKRSRAGKAARWA